MMTMSKDNLQAKIMEKIGKKTKVCLYSLNRNICFVNHAANGSIMRQIHLKELELKFECERMPEVWFKTGKRRLFDKNRLALVNYLKLDMTEQLVMTENDKDSWNYVFNSIYCDQDDSLVLVNDHLNEKTLRMLKKYRLNVIKVPTSNTVAGILGEFEKTLKSMKDDHLKRISIVLIEHVTINTAVVYPVTQIIDMLFKSWFVDRRNKPLVLIDGTNAFGQVTALRKTYSFIITS
jgi:selenocysteine lyase/cysteine desulfurase